MSTITAAMVQELRKKTDAGIMECKKALMASNGDIDQAIDFLRSSGKAKADKKKDRITAEGIVVAKVADNLQSCVLVELNCETDFVARQQQFKDMAQDIATLALQSSCSDIETLMAKDLASSQPLSESLTQLIATIGENISLRRVEFFTCQPDSILAFYLHGSPVSRIASVVSVTGNSSANNLAQSIAMQVCGMNPQYISIADVPADVVEKETQILAARAKEQNPGKPQNILDNIVKGLIQKSLGAITLVEQDFIFENKKKVSQVLAENNIKVNYFARMEVGEGIEKPTSDFREEVMAQVDKS